MLHLPLHQRHPQPQVELQLPVLHQGPLPGRAVHHRVREGPVLARRSVGETFGEWIRKPASMSKIKSLTVPVLLNDTCLPFFPDFLGRTEVPVATIKKEMESKGAANRRLLLHEVATGEVWVKLDLQLYETTK